MKKILGIGNALVDIMVKIDNDHILNELELPKGSMQLVDKTRSNQVLERVKAFDKSNSAGGSTANTIHGLGMLGAKSGFIGVVGEDEFGGAFVRDMVNAGVDLHMIHSKNETGRVVALVTPDFERTFATHLGASAEFSMDFVNSFRYSDYNYVLIEGFLVQDHQLVRTVAEKAKAAGLITAIDLCSYNVVEANRDFLNEIITKYIDIVFANEEEAKALTGLEPRKALDEIASKVKIAVVKIGSKGSMIKSGEASWDIGVIKVQPVDTTGAGDLYASGFLYGLSQGKSLETCGECGAKLSGNVIEFIGSKMSRERWNMIKAEVK
ncbi:MAG: adenosine kinase [Bacteroidetes bacterium]|nr:adenosine kinase [Bacteroidota bacterium]